MIPVEEDEADNDKRLSMVDEALVAGTIANTNGRLVILAKQMQDQMESTLAELMRYLAERERDD
jgi:hypothetical protein